MRTSGLESVRFHYGTRPKMLSEPLIAAALCRCRRSSSVSLRPHSKLWLLVNGGGRQGDTEKLFRLSVRASSLQITLDANEYGMVRKQQG
jgi:hypothetical protein